MSRRFDQYYQSELAYLRDMGRAFAAAHPAIAGLLAERGADPDVERMLEGFSFLSARIRQRIDDALPELVEPLVDALLPHYLRPTPATTMVQFTPPRGAMRGRVVLPRGSAVASKPVEGTPCQFRTTQDVDLLPISLTEQRLVDPTTSAPTLQLRFEIAKGGAPAVFHPRGLRLHLHGELAVASHLYLWLVRHLRTVEVVPLEGPSEKVTLPADVVKPAECGADEGLFPWPRGSNDGTRRLLEFSAFPSRFLFVDVTSLDRAALLDCERFELRFHFDRPPPLHVRLPEDVVRLHCSPVVNLFEASAEPIRGDGTARPCLLRPAGMNPFHAEVFSVDSVIGIVSRSGERRTYVPFHAFEHALTRRPSLGYYVTMREASPVDDGIHVSLAIGAPRDLLPRMEEETLSVELTCTNRSLPNALRVGDVCVPTGSTLAGLKFTNIGTVTRPLRPPLGSELEWRLLAHLSLGHASLAEARALKTHLHLHNFQETADQVHGRANRRRIDGLEAIEASASVRSVRGGPVRGLSVQLDFEEAAFGSLGEAFLFGSVLERLLGERAPISSFVATSLRLRPTNARLTWDPRNGSTTIV